MVYYTNYNSKFCEIIIASDGEKIIGVWIKNQKYFLNGIKEKMTKKDNLEIFIKTKKWLDRYFNGEKTSPYELELNPIGNGFRRLVWKELLDIPYGKVTTYGEIAKKIAKIQNKEKMSAQAVGGAVGHNPISIIIPCHRVVGKDGSLTGYAGGIEIKKKLLLLEKIELKNEFVNITNVWYN